MEIQILIKKYFMTFYQLLLVNKRHWQEKRKVLSMNDEILSGNSKGPKILPCGTQILMSA